MRLIDADVADKWMRQNNSFIDSAILKAIPTIDAVPVVRCREQVEKVWRGEWLGSADGYADGELVYDTWECSHCGYVIDEEDDPDMLPQFCPKCYAAMTDEAVEMVMEKWKGVLNEHLPSAGSWICGTPLE